ncbi:endonuclease/exonuclease/phosphatase family protein [Haloferula sp.]|uniref:endonuclease/exonuclease/phosphatase family protein n=1 Tax=Haloferula sp. TaxID=2497595 RepID=UPI003C781E55
MIRLLTYNIHGCIGRSGREDPDAILEVIRQSEADVVALQEVHDDDATRTRLLNRAEEIGFSTVTHGPVLQKSRGPYGNVLMSRVPPRKTQRIDLDLGGIEARGAIRFHLDLPDRPLDVCATHLGLAPAERLRQIRRIDQILADADEGHDDGIQVLMGDLNEWRPATRFMRTLRRRFPIISRQSTFPARRPCIALDRIAVRGEGCEVRFQRLDLPPADRASDHRPLLAEIEFG